MEPFHPDDLAERYVMMRVLKMNNYLVNRSGFTASPAVQQVLGTTDKTWLTQYLTTMHNQDKPRFYKEMARVIVWQQENCQKLIKNNEYAQYGDRSFTYCSPMLQVFFLTLLPESATTKESAALLTALLLEKIRNNSLPEFNLKALSMPWFHSVFEPYTATNPELNAALNDLKSVLSVSCSVSTRYGVFSGPRAETALSSERKTAMLHLTANPSLTLSP